MRRSRVLFGFVVICGLLLLPRSPFGPTVPHSQMAPTTELSCNFGMAKDQKSGSCTIPVPQGCVVAHFPGTNKAWSNISKGGRTTCRFDEKTTDWKQRVTGICDRCKTVQCSARFSVMIQCGG